MEEEDLVKLYTPIEAHDKIKEILLRQPDLKYKNWQDQKEPIILDNYCGFCYVATYAFCHLISEAKPYRNLWKSHYWAQIDDEIWDLTKEQFNSPFPYHEGVKLPRKFKPTKRVQKILKELDEL